MGMESGGLYNTSHQLKFGENDCLSDWHKKKRIHRILFFLILIVT